jgi:hypothetical protein
MLHLRGWPRLIALAGLLALVVLACALVLTVGGLGRIATVTEAASASTSPERTRAAKSERETAPTLEQCRPVHSNQALRQDRQTPGGVEFRHSKVCMVLPEECGSLSSKLPAWLPHMGIRRPALSAPSLQILFCTWRA